MKKGSRKSTTNKENRTKKSERRENTTADNTITWNKKEMDTERKVRVVNLARK